MRNRNESWFDVQQFSQFIIANKKYFLCKKFWLSQTNVEALVYKIE